MASVMSAIKNTVPISQFNRGLAGKIFEDVKQSGAKVVMKNNVAECVLISPEEYVRLMDEVNDARLLAVASERMAHFNPATLISEEEMRKLFETETVESAVVYPCRHLHLAVLGNVDKRKRRIIPVRAVFLPRYGIVYPVCHESVLAELFICVHRIFRRRYFIKNVFRVCDYYAKNKSAYHGENENRQHRLYYFTEKFHIYPCLSSPCGEYPAKGV